MTSASDAPGPEGPPRYGPVPGYVPGYVPPGDGPSPGSWSPGYGPPTGNGPPPGYWSPRRRGPYFPGQPAFNKALFYVGIALMIVGGLWQIAQNLALWPPRLPELVPMVVALAGMAACGLSGILIQSSRAWALREQYRLAAKAAAKAAGMRTRARLADVLRGRHLANRTVWGRACFLVGLASLLFFTVVTALVLAGVITAPYDLAGLNFPIMVLIISLIWIAQAPFDGPRPYWHGPPYWGGWSLGGNATQPPPPWSGPPSFSSDPSPTDRSPTGPSPTGPSPTGRQPPYSPPRH